MHFSLKKTRISFRSLLSLLIIVGLSFAASTAAAQSQPAKQSKSKPTAKQAPTQFQEDFSALPLAKNSLKRQMEVLGEKDDKPGLPFIRERWHLMWREGDPIDVYVVKPRGVERPPVILYLYSYPQDTDRFKQDHWCGYVTGDGFAAVGFVSALTGHRLEHRAPRENFFNQLPESLGASVHDVQMILNYLADRKDLDMTRVGMFGQGSGGSIAILASSVDPRIKALDTLTAWGDWPLFISKSTFIPSEDRLEINKQEFLAKVSSLDPLKWLPLVKAQSVRLQNVRHDGHMPDEAQEALEDVSPDRAEINQFGDGAALVPAAANGRLLDWVKSQLQIGAKPQVAMDKSQRIHFYPPKAPTGSPLGDIRQK